MGSEHQFALYDDLKTMALLLDYEPPSFLAFLSWDASWWPYAQTFIECGALYLEDGLEKPEAFWLEGK